MTAAIGAPGAGADGVTGDDDGDFAEGADDVAFDEDATDDDAALEPAGSAEPDPCTVAREQAVTNSSAARSPMRRIPLG